MAKKALIMVDLQNDFCAGGNLAVPEGDAVIPIANKLQPHFDIIIATQDWHPSDHMSFASNHDETKIGDVIKIEEFEQVLWPDHCVQNSKGAEFHPQLDQSRIHKIFHKGIQKEIDSYSAFFDNAHKRQTGLHTYLHSQNVKDVYLMGLATDYCVKYSALDAAHLGYNVTVIFDACRGVELNVGDIEKSYAEMRAAGVQLMTSAEFFRQHKMAS